MLAQRLPCAGKSPASIMAPRLQPTRATRPVSGIARDIQQYVLHWNGNMLYWYVQVHAQQLAPYTTHRHIPCQPVRRSRRLALRVHSGPPAADAALGLSTGGDSSSNGKSSVVCG